MSKYTNAIRTLAKMKALDADSAERLLNAHAEEQDGGPGSGNFGHAGRPGKKGGSAPGKGGSGGAQSKHSQYGPLHQFLHPSWERPDKPKKPEKPMKPMEIRKGETPELLKKAESPEGVGAGDIIEYMGKQIKLSPQSKNELSIPGGESKGTSSKKQTTSTALSPVHAKRSLAKRDDRMLNRLKNASKNPGAMKSELDSMKPGSMIRLNERGYSVFEKKPDGSWVYQKYHGGETPVDIKDVVDSIRGTGLKAVSSPKKGEEGRSQYWDNIRAVADLEPNAGDRYTGKRVTFGQALKNGSLRAKGVLKFPKETGNKSSAYTHEEIDDNGIIRKTGQASSVMPNGTGTTKISTGDLMKPNPDEYTYNSLQEHCMEDANGNLVLTPEREKLHQGIINELFEGAIKPGPGEEKVMTFMGGGSAAGKGTIQKSGVANLPDKEHSPVIDADEMKKRIPEYVDTAFSENHEKAASMGHEESSSLANRAMRAAIANGYSFTLDGTGDGNPQKQVDKIKMAQANGYVVKGCYVTCPTEMAVKRNAGRSQTDEYNRLVPEKEVRTIHAKVSGAFETVAKAMNECSLYDTSGEQPVLIAKYENGKEVYKDQEKYNAFIAKKSEGEVAKAAEAKKKKA